MINNVKISPIQLFFLIVAVIWGDATIINPVSGVGTDAWVAFIIGWGASFLLIGLYVYISNSYPSKTLIEILRECFGNFLGTVIGILYVWYFIHLSSLVFRSFNEYLITTSYPETPLIFLIIIWMLVAVFILHKGIEVIGRLGELLIPTVFIIVFLLTGLSIDKMDLGKLQPFLTTDFSAIIRASFGLLTFPFGESIVFLMIFPYINKREKLTKTVFLSVAVSGIVLLMVILRNISILGIDLISKTTFPTHTITTLIPTIVIEPFLAVNLLITGGTQTVMFSYAAILAIAQLLNLDDYKPFVFPVAILCASLSMWIYEDLPEMFRIAKEIYPFYSLPFQVLIPLLILMVTLIKKKLKRHNENEKEGITESS